MGRIARRAAENGIYHVVERGAGRRILFEDDDDRLFFLEKLRRSMGENGIGVYAWCLMENHVHAAVSLSGSLESLSNAMRSLNTAYARYYNGRHGHVGSVFQDRYKSFPVDSDAYLLELIRYIHLNPVVPGVADLESYPWSSYREVLRGEGLCCCDEVLALFGGIDGFVSFHEHGLCDVELVELDPRKEDLSIARRTLSDGEALGLMKRAFGEDAVGSIAAKPRAERDEAIRRLRRLGLTVRQIERLTGVGRGVIQRC